MTNYQQVQKRKSIYIPLCCAGKMTIQQAAQKIGVTPHCVSMLKRKYRESGVAAFSRSDRGHVAYNLKYDKDFQVKLLMIYHESWEGCPYKTFWRALQDFYNININYESLRQILRKNGIKPLRKLKSKEKPMHESRKENKRTDKWGYFVFHSHDFKLLAPRPAHQKFTLLLSEQFGIKALLDGKYYDVELCDTFNDSLANKMPQVEKDLIDRYLMNDLHNDSYA